MPKTTLITDENGREVQATLKDLQDRCTLLRASKLVQDYKNGDSDPLLDLVFGHQPPSEQDDDLPIKDWSIERCARHWEEYREEYAVMLSAGELIGSCEPLDLVAKPRS